MLVSWSHTAGRDATLSEDKLTYSFTLKDGVTFHNGAPLTSNDVKYSLERMVSKYKMSSLLEKVAGYQEFFDEQADEITGIEIVDDTHFNIHMSEIYTPLLSALPHLTAQSIRQRHVKRPAMTGV